MKKTESVKNDKEDVSFVFLLRSMPQVLQGCFDDAVSGLYRAKLENDKELALRGQKLRVVFAPEFGPVSHMAVPVSQDEAAAIVQNCTEELARLHMRDFRVLKA